MMSGGGAGPWRDPQVSFRGRRAVGQTIRVKRKDTESPPPDRSGDARDPERREGAPTTGRSQTVPRGDGFWVSATEAELLEALEEVGDDLDLDDARAALRNPYASERVVRGLLAVEGLRPSYQWRKDLAWSRHTPPAVAMSLVPGLYWRDLAQLARDVRVHARLRRQAEEILLQRLQKLALGERIALARVATPALLSVLRNDPNERVFRALLENARLNEGALLAVAMNSGSRPGILRILARDRRWGARYELRRALVRNPRTPLQDALAMVAALKKVDLRACARDTKIRPEIRQRCRLRLGDGP